MSVADGGSPTSAEQLARALSVPFELTPTTSALQLLQTPTHIELRDPASGARLRVEYTAAELRRYRPGASRDLLRRAIGTHNECVVDATAGLGHDAVHLACLGYRVTAIERNAIVAMLASDGLNRARADGLLAADNPEWRTDDARLLLPMLAPPQAIYLDPMFPEKRKRSAAVRKEMHLLRALVADDDDALELLAVARACATDRVVVKRPDHAPPLAPQPTASYAGKLVRYDVYRTLEPRSR